MSISDQHDRNTNIWRRFRLVMARMAGGTALALGLSLALLWHFEGPLPLNPVIAISLGLFVMVMLTGALMGLSFVSSSTGHDEQVIPPVEPPSSTSPWDYRNWNKPL